jgi:hypothetical protein
MLLAVFGLLLLGSTSAFAGNGHGQNGQGQNNQGNNNQGNNNQGKGGGLLNLIEGIINDIFGDGNQGKNSQGSNQGSSDGGTWTNGGGGGTAPIDGGLSLLLVAGVGLGIKKMAGRRTGV